MALIERDQVERSDVLRAASVLLAVQEAAHGMTSGSGARLALACVKAAAHLADIADRMQELSLDDAVASAVQDQDPDAAR